MKYCFYLFLFVFVGFVFFFCNMKNFDGFLEILFNIFFIFIDDFGWKDVSYNGFNFYVIFNIDWIVQEGFIFINGYVACQVCSFLWVSIMIGKFLV